MTTLAIEGIYNFQKIKCFKVVDIGGDQSRQKNKDVFGLYESADALIKLLELHKYDMRFPPRKIIFHL